MRRCVFTVQGSWPFPFDMLRYDGCWPYSSTDASKMELVCGEHAAEIPETWLVPGTRRSIEITFESVRRPTARRWESFDWRVVKEES